MYKVFINDVPLIIVKKNDFKIRSNKYIVNPNKKEINIIIKGLHSGSIKEKYFILTNRIKYTWTIFSSFYKTIKAAGGVVHNNEDKILFIFRNNYWDLPKGKIKKNEKITDAAIREVEEECGIQNVKIKKELSTTYHSYNYKNENILKEVFWFKMNSNYKGNLTPQKEEGITKVKWIEKKKINSLLKQSYPSIKDLFS